MGFFITPEGWCLKYSSGVIYGLQWDEDADTYTRTGTLAGETLGSSPDDSLLPIQAAMRPCVYDPSTDNVVYYLDPDDVTQKADGSAANLDGSDGQVCVEIEKYWYKYDYSGTTHHWQVANYAADGFDVHPAFETSSGSYDDHIYIGRYEGVLYNDSDSAYIDSSGDHTDILGDASAETIDTSNDYLGSISGKIPLSDETRDEFRTLAENAGGHLESIHDTMAYRLLFIIEYADLNWQDAVGAGKTNNDNSHDYLASTGESDGVGATGSQEATNSTATDGYFVYRNIENPFGNLSKWIDGFNVNNDGISSKAYIATVNDASIFDDDTSTGYTYVGDLAESDGYVDTLMQTSLGILPATVGASSSTKVGDYYYTTYDNDASSGWRVVLLGGRLSNWVAAGGSYWASHYSAGTNFWFIGGRLVFHPSE